MIKKGHQEVEEIRAEGSHGGEGPCFVRTLMQTEFDSSLAYIREIVLPPNSSIGFHKHEGDEELYYIVSGNGVMTVDHEKQLVCPGDAILTKSGSSHGLKNTGGNDLKFFVVCCKLRS